MGWILGADVYTLRTDRIEAGWLVDFKTHVPFFAFSMHDVYEFPSPKIIYIYRRYGV